MKKQVRVLGIDDSPFTFRSERVLVVGVVTRLPNYIEGIMRAEAAVDGNTKTTFDPRHDQFGPAI